MGPGEYRRLLDVISRVTADAVATIVRAAIPGLPEAGRERRRARDAIADRITPVIWRQRAKARDLARRFLEEQARQNGIQGEVFLPSPPPYSRESMRTALADLDNDGALAVSPQDAADRVASVAVRHTEDAARRTVVQAVEDNAPDDVAEPHEDAEDRWEAEDFGPAIFAGWDRYEDISETGNTFQGEPKRKPTKRARPARWARVLTGAENCAFCVMLAARGAVYESADTARGDILRPGEGGLAYRFHNNCDCVTVPVYSKQWAGAETARQLDALYREALDSVSKNELQDTDEEPLSPVQLRKLRKYLREHPEKLSQVVGNLREAA